MKTMLRSIAGLGVTLILAGCGALTVSPIAQFFDDTGTTTAIKTRLATEGGLGSLAGIGVHTREDMVTLTGTVADDAERRRVETIARRIAGDNRVVSDLRVANSVSASPAAQPAAQKR